MGLEDAAEGAEAGCSLQAAPEGVVVVRVTVVAALAVVQVGWGSEAAMAAAGCTLQAALAAAAVVAAGTARTVCTAAH